MQCRPAAAPRRMQACKHPRPPNHAPPAPSAAAVTSCQICCVRASSPRLRVAGQRGCIDGANKSGAGGCSQQQDYAAPSLASNPTLLSPPTDVATPSTHLTPNPPTHLMRPCCSTDW